MPLISADDLGARKLLDSLDAGDGPRGRPKLGNWSSIIGITTAIVGNILIALALNVQRYSHIQLHRCRLEARERANKSSRRAQTDDRKSYGTVREPPSPRSQAYDEEVGHGMFAQARPLPSRDSDYSESSADEDEDAASMTYLKSPLWWTGQVLMTVGEMGNFLAYGFASASIVSPLGVVALISNCVIAPLFFGEIFRKSDFWGVLIAIGGAVTVVLSADQEETKMDPHDVWGAITTDEFEIYMVISISLIAILMWASPRYGNRTIFIDLGLVGLFGAYTALTTKGISSMLSATLLHAFTTPVTYLLILILIGTAVMQVHYVNKALQRHDSTLVIPIQFVLFTLSVIVGSAILYRDFERTSPAQAARFMGGCSLTFFGVFLIANGRPSHDHEEDMTEQGDAEDIFGLRNQDAVVTLSMKADGCQSASPRSPRLRFGDPFLPPLNALYDTGVPTLRAPDGRRLRTPAGPESSPLLGDGGRRPTYPPLHSRVSNASMATTRSMSSSNTSLLQPAPGTLEAAYADEMPLTPRASFSSRPHSHHFTGNLFSPSPLSSTVTAVVSDALRGDDRPQSRRMSRLARHARHGLRASTFAEQDEDEEPDPGLGGAHEQRPVSAAHAPAESRSRATSFSVSLGQFFGRKRKRRHTNPASPAESTVAAVPAGSGWAEGRGSGPGPVPAEEDDESLTR